VETKPLAGMPGIQVSCTNAQAGDFEPLSDAAQTTIWLAFLAFGLQTLFHWCRASCTGQSRSEQHEMIASSATGSFALVYLAMANGLSKSLYAASGPRPCRVFFPVDFLGRLVCVDLALLNVAVLARERRPQTVGVVVTWSLVTSALYCGCLVDPGPPRFSFFAFALVAFVPVMAALLCSMGSRTRGSSLQTPYRFLATWGVVCGTCFFLAFLAAQIFGIVNSETEIMLLSLLDYCIVGVSGLVVSCNDPGTEMGLLPAQEAELSLYPGPHSHGFYPNPDYYDDNL